MTELDGSPAAPIMARRAPGWLGPTIDYGPLLVFIAAYLGFDILTATAAMVVAAFAALLLSLAVTRRVPLTSLIISITVLAFGGLTLWFDDPRYIKLQSTLINLLFSFTLVGALALRRPLLLLFFGAALTMSRRGWRSLTIRFAGFFAAMAGLNELVARTMSTEVWANYYTFGTTLLTIAFIAAQWPLIQREAHDDNKPPGETR
jgi:intracellular septation protein